MSTATLYRLSKIGIWGGGIAVILGLLCSIFLGNNASSVLVPVTSMLRFVGGGALLLGFTGVYANLSVRSGGIGFLGFLFTYFAFLTFLAFEPILGFVFPYLSVKAPELLKGDPPIGLFIFGMAGTLLLLIGGVLLSIAVLRSHIGTRTIGVLLLVSTVISAVGNFINFDVVGDIGNILFIFGLMFLSSGMKSDP